MSCELFCDSSTDAIASTSDTGPGLGTVMEVVESGGTEVGGEEDGHLAESICDGEKASGVDYLCDSRHAGDGRVNARIYILCSSMNGLSRRSIGCCRRWSLECNHERMRSSLV